MNAAARNCGGGGNDLVSMRRTSISLISGRRTVDRGWDGGRTFPKMAHERARHECMLSSAVQISAVCLNVIVVSRAEILRKFDTVCRVQFTSRNCGAKIFVTL